MNIQTLTSSLSQESGLPETDLIYKGLIAFIEKKSDLQRQR